GIEETWDILLTIRPGTKSRIDYPSLNCMSELTVLARTPSEIEFREDVINGDCITGGRISARLVEKRIFWFWHMPGGQFPADASAVVYPNDEIALLGVRPRTQPAVRLHHLTS